MLDIHSGLFDMQLKLNLQMLTISQQSQAVYAEKITLSACSSKAGLRGEALACDCLTFKAADLCVSFHFE